MNDTNHLTLMKINPALECETRINTDYFGFDIVSEPIIVFDFESCCAECNDILECLFWTYVTNMNECWLKNSSDGRVFSNTGYLDSYKRHKSPCPSTSLQPHS
eukprot:TRINITY_DN14045_c0_g1_i1.p1 TRINITY_DN14045_c0_g1~~TRINITY_DN14045_c0_g1_i1.p1  ORF type:complete len:111 (+),score=10.35 TRINITY_DN14045_c0_g1_i1:26-334(+)